MKKLSLFPRVALAIGALLVIACYFLPLWEIQLWAPQYPEGLSIQIWHNNLTGDVDVINGLNHYIGMKHLKVEMFPEFKFLKYILAAFIVLTLFTAWKGSVRALQIYCVIVFIAGCIALADFYRWGYDYGHNLNDDAPIKVPGMAYQPPVIGYKVLLNFTALSVPASGGWIIVGLGTLAFAILGFVWINNRRNKPNAAALILIPLALTLYSCNKAAPSITFGKDNCSYCKMTIMDKKFGALIVTDKGRTYTFDDIKCKTAFLQSEHPAISGSYVVAYDKPGQLIVQETAFYLKGESVKSPMGGGVAAFSTHEACKAAEAELHGVCSDYAGLSAN